MYTYMLVHEHKHGHSTYWFKSKKKITHFDRSIRKQLIEIFKIRLEPEKMETLELTLITEIQEVKLKL